MDKIFGTDGIRCLVNKEPLTAETCLKISKVVAYLLKSKKNVNSRVVVCKDTRLSGYFYEPLVTGGFISMGMDVILVGPLPTPAVPLLIKTLRADIGVMITASHNTYEYNGLKFFDSKGLKLSNKIEKKVEEIVLNKNKYSKIRNLSFKSGKAIRLEDASGRYSEFLKNTLDKKNNQKKYKIVLDCANGATYNIAPNLFWELGHEIHVINDKPNGTNINKNCGAVETTNLIKKVKNIKADIGFAFDGDGDRLIVVDDKGQEIDGDKIIALFSKFFVKKNIKNKYDVITTVMSNLAFENYITNKLNLRLKRTNVGDINVIKGMKKYDSILGGEQSGHIILSNFANTGDGILAALKIVEVMSIKRINSNSLFNLYKNYPQVKINIFYEKISKQKKKKILSISKNKQFLEKSIRTLIRFSGTEPLIRILVEGVDKKVVRNMANKIELEVRSKLD